MKKMLRFSLLVGITACVTGCKLAVIVVEGGEVQSTSSGVCIASAICIVDVDDPNFSESFRAAPHSGWYFQKWNSGDRFFCGGATNATCELSFEDHKDSKAVADMVASSEMFYLMPVFREVNPDSPPGSDKEWLEPNDFGGYSYEQVIAVCPPPSGKCSGTLPNSAFDLTGYYWALVAEVDELFNSYGASEEQFFEDFDAAADRAELLHYGWARAPAEEEYLSYITVAEYRFSDNSGFMNSTALGINSESPYPPVGPWFWRPVNN